jgi:predicted molibdopterin-dependent oxidoreductase YjgC
MNSVEEPVNRLTSSHTDKVTHTPAYKETSVQLEVLGETGENPLPRTNSRFGIRRRRMAWKWSASGSARIIATRQSTGSDQRR